MGIGINDVLIECWGKVVRSRCILICCWGVLPSVSVHGLGNIETVESGDNITVLAKVWNWIIHWVGSSIFLWMEVLSAAYRIADWVITFLSVLSLELLQLLVLVHQAICVKLKSLEVPFAELLLSLNHMFVSRNNIFVKFVRSVINDWFIFWNLYIWVEVPLVLSEIFSNIETVPGVKDFLVLSEVWHEVIHWVLIFLGFLGMLVLSASS
jgi:hypothetical protein